MGETVETKAVLHAELGRIRYGPALELQRRLHARRREGQVPDVLLSLEHTPVITLGRRGKESHILASPEELARLGVEVFPIERGGDVTYHGPGQLVLYPILDLRGYRLDLHRYVRNLEEVMIRTAQAFGVRAQRRTGFPGAWAERGKLGAVGIHVNGWVTLHGLALNVDLHPNGFDLIVPCGLAGVRTVSIAELAGRPIPLGEAALVALNAFSELFGVDLIPVGGEVIRGWAS